MLPFCEYQQNNWINLPAVQRIKLLALTMLDCTRQVCDNCNSWCCKLLKSILPVARFRGARGLAHAPKLPFFKHRSLYLALAFSSLWYLADETGFQQWPPQGRLLAKRPPQIYFPTNTTLTPIELSSNQELCDRFLYPAHSNASSLKASQSTVFLFVRQSTPFPKASLWRQHKICGILYECCWY